jgi:Na+/proline symporter
VATLHWIDVLIILAFIVYAVSSGIRSRKVASQSLEEYFLAGRSLSGWSAGLSMAATQFAADTPLLVTGLVATAGIFAIWQLWIFALAFLLMGFILAPSWRRASVLTDAELSELRYSKGAATALRGIKAIYFGTIFNCVVLAWVLFATKAIVEPFLVWDQWLPAALYQPILHLVTWVDIPLSVNPHDPHVWVNSTNNLISILGIVTVTLFYSTTGGLRSVVATDVVQFSLAMLGTAFYMGYIIYHFGGMGPIIEQIRERFATGGPGGISPNQILAFVPSQAKDASFAVLAVLGLQWLIQLNADGTGYLAQRSMACKSDRDAKLASVVFTIAQVLLRSLFWLPIALGLLLFFPPDLSLAPEILKHEREVTFVKGIVELLPWGIKGLMLTAMLAALASTIDTHLNWGASYWTNDIYKRLICQVWLKRDPNPRTLVWVARGSNLIILMISMLVMTQLTSIERAWKIALLLGAGMGVVLVLRWLWWRISAWGELACIIVSLLAAWPLLEFVDDEAIRLLVMAVLATAAGIGVSLLTTEDPEHLRRFFRLAQPPGWWGPIAASLGVDPGTNVKRLGRGFAAMLSAAFCVFFFLTGIGSWLCHSPVPTWWSLSWGLWIALQLVMGIALVPVWLKLGFSQEAEKMPLPVHAKVTTLDPTLDDR